MTCAGVGEPQPFGALARPPTSSSGATFYFVDKGGIGHWLTPAARAWSEDRSGRQPCGGTRPERGDWGEGLSSDLAAEVIRPLRTDVGTRISPRIPDSVDDDAFGQGVDGGLDDGPGFGVQPQPGTR